MTRPSLAAALLAPALAGSGCALPAHIAVDPARLAPMPAAPAAPAGPVPATRYAFAPAHAASDRGAPIDVAAENAAVSAALRAAALRGALPRYPVVVVPGFASDDAPDAPLHPRARERLELAARAFRQHQALAILVTGGNVHPAGTPFNEALEMKRALVADHGIAPEQIAVDPYARHTTTNLRNAGRFLLAHGLDRALVVTTWGQNLYLGLPVLSTYHGRCRGQLGYEVGHLRLAGLTRTVFEPAAEVLRRGSDPLDP